MQVVAAKHPAPIEEAFTRLWSLPGSFDKAKHVVLFGDTLYVAGTPRGMSAINIKDGIQRWTHIGRFVVDHPPTIRKDELHFLEGGQFVALNRKTSEQMYRVRSRVGSVTPVYPGASTLLVGGGGDHVYGVHRRTGYRAWQEKIDAFAEKSTWDGDDLVFMVSSKGTVSAISISTRRTVWSRKFSRPGANMPHYLDGVVYVGSNNFRLYALDSASGIIDWRVILGARVTGTPVVAHGRVYVSTDNNILHAVDTETHEVLWQLKGAARVITATKSHVITLHKTPMMNLIGVVDAATGNVLSEFSAQYYEHFAAEAESGVFYAVARGGDILALAHRSAQVSPANE